MKPKIKKAHVYSVLFMRDDSGVTRFRVRAIWLKLMLLLFVLMTMAAAAGGYAAHYYWQRYEYHKAEAQGLEAERAENRRELERLANLENILKSNDPELLRTLVSNVPVNGDTAQDPLT
ncbi:hypothetical protein LJC23_01755, partial [Desulfovibrio sp. OttesenSCG-928-I05]|nr:hypothetical protein [Desulfovibrio sp. OttesenSCG-928-I05]